MSRLDVNVPELEIAYREFLAERNNLNWILFVTDGQLVSVLDITPKVYFGALKVTAKYEKSLQKKLVSFKHIGIHLSTLQKTKVDALSPIVEKIVRPYTISLDTDGSLSNFSRPLIAKALLAAAGANRPTHYVFGTEDEIAVEGLP